LGPVRAPFFMSRFAVFVDAGYLLAWGAERKVGARAPRNAINCDYPALISALITHCQALAPGEELLRLYWYDGAPYSGITPDQRAIGDRDDVKVRLGRLTGHGQKGVDTLLVLDLTTLARERAIASAFLLSGDEDLREGVLAAQQMGVRVILLGLAATATSGQADALKREVDRQSDLSTIVDGHLTNVVTPAYHAGLTFGQGWLAAASVPERQQMTAAKAHAPLHMPPPIHTQLLGQVQTAVNPGHPGKRLEPWEAIEARRGFWASIP
jgi:uncharacterized LabA/DUF88 family protein